MDSNNQYTFFDDSNDKGSFAFVKPGPSHLKDLKVMPQLISNLVCKSVASGSFIQGLYALQNGLLVYYEGGFVGLPTEILDIQFSKLKLSSPPSSKSQNIIILTKNGISFELIFSDSNIADSWFTALKKFCVLTSFHEEYQAIKMIGKGGFAKVYLAVEKASGKKFAVKCFAKMKTSPGVKSKSEAILINEISIMRSLNHDNIIKIHEVHESANSVYLIMELIEGKTLQAHISKSSFRNEYLESQIVTMMRSILDAVAYISSKGIMHRDLKPDNILLDNTGKIKLVDFGLATYIDLPKYLFKKCGTPGYMAPEVFKYEENVPSTSYDSRCDVFSAGCILFYMLFGVPLFNFKRVSEALDLNKKFTGTDSVELLTKEINNPDSKVNQQGLNLLLKLLEYNPKKRISAIQALTHPYFAPPATLNPKFSSCRDIRYDGLSKYSIHVSPLYGNKKSERGSAISRSDCSDNEELVTGSRNRFTQKNSLYLDIGKPEFTGRIRTVTNKSGNVSISIKGEEVRSPLSGMPRTRSQSKTSRLSDNQNFLKILAINNNTRRNNSKGQCPWEEVHGPRFERWKSDNVLPEPNKGTSAASCESDEPDDVGDENCQVELNLAKVKIGTSEKHLKKQLQDHGRYVLTQKS